jgi:disulfide oxidoreductase YuzD
MRPIDIFKVLDLAKKARELGKVYNPCFSGDAGLGKSEIVQQWVKKQREHDPNYGFIDLRIAQMEAPDFVGLPEIVVNKDGKKRTNHILPNMWPEEGTSGVLFLDEINRTNPSNMNALMQLLTDRKVHHYTLPDGWIICAAINEGSNYEVTEMDSAMRDRLEFYTIEYDHKSFVDYIKKANWHQNVVNFIESGNWVYKSPNEIGNEGKYISPRTWSKLNNAELAGLQNDSDLHFQTSVAQLGKAIGREYYSFTFENRPVTLADILSDEKKALNKLKEYCDVNNYRNDLVAVTIESVVEGYGKEKDLTDKLICKIAKIIPQDQTVGFLQKIILKDVSLNKHDVSKSKKLPHFYNLDPELKELIKTNLRIKKEE